ncbi:MAG: PH domain-containing protein [Candidatus Kaiserbacteria bacterium]|nr:PH domain-containing protein [Candidatus Kaiserbacteria bacterium]
MQRLDPKSKWLFFIRYAFLGLAAAMILEIFLMLVFLSSDNPTISNAVNAMDGLTFTFWFIGIYLLLALLCSTIGTIYGYWYYRTYKYELRENGFRKEYGVISKRYVTIPYEKIQNVEIRRSLFERMLGISELQIQTAGYAGGSHAPIGGRGLIGTLVGVTVSHHAKRDAEGTLPGVPHETAEQIRNTLMQKLTQKEG